MNKLTASWLSVLTIFVLMGGILIGVNMLGRPMLTQDKASGPVTPPDQPMPTLATNETPVGVHYPAFEYANYKEDYWVITDVATHHASDTPVSAVGLEVTIVGLAPYDVQIKENEWLKTEGWNYLVKEYDAETQTIRVSLVYPKTEGYVFSPWSNYAFFNLQFMPGTAGIGELVLNLDNSEIISKNTGANVLQFAGNSRFQVMAKATPTPIPTNTPTPDPATPTPSEPTATPTMTPSPTPTPDPVVSTNFRIKLDKVMGTNTVAGGNEGIGLVIFEADNMTTPYMHVPSMLFRPTSPITEPGIYEGSFEYLRTGETYYVYAYSNGRLLRSIGTITVNPETAAYDFTDRPLLIGDLSGDLKLTIEDIAMFISIYDEYVINDYATELLPYDFNRDNKISIADFGLLLQNYTDLTIEGDNPLVSDWVRNNKNVSIPE